MNEGEGGVLSVLGIDEWFYIYRWGVSPVHLSGIKPHDEWYKRIGEMPVEQGQYFLRPHWKVSHSDAAFLRPSLGSLAVTVSQAFAVERVNQKALRVTKIFIDILAGSDYN